MENESPTNDEIDIDEAMRLTGKSRATLMRWKEDKNLTTRTTVRVHTQRQRRLLFLRSEIEALTGEEAQSAGCDAAVDKHTTAGQAQNA